MHNCPSCKRPFEQITDFPEVTVTRFERVPLPPFIAEKKYTYLEGREEQEPFRGLAGTMGLIQHPVLPKTVLHEFETTGKTTLCYQGKVYEKMKQGTYVRSHNVRPVVAEALHKMSFVFSNLNQLVGIAVQTRTLSDNIGLFKNVPINDYYDLSLKFLEHEPSAPEERITTLKLVGGASSHKHTPYSLDHTVALLHYQGHIKELNPDFAH